MSWRETPLFALLGSGFSLFAACFKGTPLINAANSPFSQKPCGKSGEKSKSVILDFSKIFKVCSRISRRAVACEMPRGEGKPAVRVARRPGFPFCIPFAASRGRHTQSCSLHEECLHPFRAGRVCRKSARLMKGGRKFLRPYPSTLTTVGGCGIIS